MGLDFSKPSPVPSQEEDVVPLDLPPLDKEEEEKEEEEEKKKKEAWDEFQQTWDEFQKTFGTYPFLPVQEMVEQLKYLYHQKEYTEMMDIMQHFVDVLSTVGGIPRMNFIQRVLRRMETDYPFRTAVEDHGMNHWPSQWSHVFPNITREHVLQLNEFETWMADYDAKRKKQEARDREWTAWKQERKEKEQREQKERERKEKERQEREQREQRERERKEKEQRERERERERERKEKEQREREREQRERKEKEREREQREREKERERERKEKEKERERKEKERERKEEKKGGNERCKRSAENSEQRVACERCYTTKIPELDPEMCKKIVFDKPTREVYKKASLKVHPDKLRAVTSLSDDDRAFAARLWHAIKPDGYGFKEERNSYSSDSHF